MNGSKDNLEDFFQQSFNDEDLVNQANNWNVPSDMVWEGIQAGLTEERRLSFAFLKWPWSAIAASYLLLMGGYQFIEKYTQEIDIASTVILEKIAFNDNLQTDNTIKVNEIMYEENIQSLTALNQPIIQELDIKKEGQIFSNNLNLLGFSKSDKSNFEKGGAVQSIDNQLIEINVVSLVSLNTEIVESLIKNNFESLASLTAKETTINIPSITKSLKKQSNIYISANYSAISENLNQQILEPSDLIVANTNTAKGNSVGVDLGLSNKKGWAIETGVHFSKLDKKTITKQVIPKSLLQENLNEDGTSKVEVNWNDSNGGNVAGLTVYNLPSNKTDLSLHLTQNTQSRFVDVPLLVRKNWRLGKLNVSVKTGLLNRFNISNSYEVPTVSSEDDQFEVLVSEFRRNTTIENRKYLPQLIAGIGLEYFIQPNLSVYVEPSFSKSIRPMIDFGFANIHSQNKAVTMGMRYHL